VARLWRGVVEVGRTLLRDDLEEPHSCAPSEHIDGPSMDNEWDAQAMERVSSGMILGRQQRRPVEATESSGDIGGSEATTRRRRS